MLATLANALASVRQPLTAEITSAMVEEGFLGVSGEAATGKSTLVRASIAGAIQADCATVVYLDLRGIYSMEKLVSAWRRAHLAALLGDYAAVWTFGALDPESLGPRATVRAREVLGDQFEASLDDSPAQGERHSDISTVLGLLLTLKDAVGRCIVVIDHLEAPLLTRRHPIVPADLLWQLRATIQHEPTISVVVVCNTGAEEVAAGPDAAFHQDGRWLSVDSPGLGEWQDVAARVGIQLSPALLDFAGQHTATMLSLMRLTALHRLSPAQAFEELASRGEEDVQRSLMHASSLHRLGGHLLSAIARGEGPYSAVPGARTDDTANAIQLLRLAGLLRRGPDESRSWRLVNPITGRLIARTSSNDLVGTVTPARHPQGLRGWREAAGITQAELARRAGISQATLRRAESGSGVKASTQHRILRAFEQLAAPRVRVTLEDLFQHPTRHRREA